MVLGRDLNHNLEEWFLAEVFQLAVKGCLPADSGEYSE